MGGIEGNCVSENQYQSEKREKNLLIQSEKLLWLKKYLTGIEN